MTKAYACLIRSGPVVLQLLLFLVIIFWNVAGNAGSCSPNVAGEDQLRETCREDPAGLSSQLQLHFAFICFS